MRKLHGPRISEWNVNKVLHPRLHPGQLSAPKVNVCTQATLVSDPKSKSKMLSLHVCTLYLQPKSSSFFLPYFWTKGTLPHPWSWNLIQHREHSGLWPSGAVYHEDLPPEHRQAGQDLSGHPEGQVEPGPPDPHSAPLHTGHLTWLSATKTKGDCNFPIRPALGQLNLIS